VNLERLVKSQHKVLACVTQPDKPRDRHLKVTALPVKEVALKHGLPVIQPEIISKVDVIKQLESFAADLFVVIAYGKILPEKILSIPKKFCVNVHASLLPKYRGAAPIHWAIINDEQVTGVSIIKMNTKMDAGEIVSQREVRINPEDNSSTLKVRLAQAGAELLLETIKLIGKNTFRLTPQNEAEAIYTKKLTKELGRIDWSDSAVNIHNRVRGLVPWPGAYTHYKGKILKILETQIVDTQTKQSQPGQIVQISKQGMDVAAGTGILRVGKVHLESSKVMDVQSFVVGHKIAVGFSSKMDK
jgi:methionyl-tRNA formyltransferase